MTPPAALPSDLPADPAAPARSAPSTRVVFFDDEADARAEAPLAASKQLDPFQNRYVSMGLLEPPFGPDGYRVILYRYDESDALQSAVDAMVTNVCAFGVQFSAYASDLPPDTTADVEAERKRLTAWFAHAGESGSFNSVRKRVRRDVELFGDGYYEVLRDPKGRLAGMEHIPGDTMRKSKLAEKAVLADGWVRQPDGTFVKRKLWRRFRRFAQYIDGVYRWFKHIGDPRLIRADSGEEDPNARPEDLANEVLPVCRYEPGSVYGKPRWRGAATSAKGRSAAGSVNADIFDNRGIPPMAILVQGAHFDDEVVERIKEFFRAAKGRRNFNTPMILEAVSATVSSDPSDPGGLSRPGAPPKIDFKDLTSATPTDAQFLKYRDECVRDLAMTYRLPPIYMGRTDAYNFATAQAARQVAEEQVFQPERADEDDLLNAYVLPELEARWCRLTTKGPPLLDEKTLVQVIDLGVRTGALTVNNVADLLEPILGVELSSAEAWRRVPARVIQALADKGVLPAEIAATLGAVVSLAGFGGGGGAPPGTDGTAPPVDGAATNDPAAGDATTPTTDDATGDGSEANDPATAQANTRDGAEPAITPA